jgi:glycosyltransferase involved in cell wall biosynthesis
MPQQPTITFITSTPTNVREGSGTHVGISVLRGALERMGYHVPLVTPAPGSHPLGYTLQRVWFNATAGPRIAAQRPDLVVGVDLDGFALTHRYAPRGVAAIKGIIADELTYEDWSVRVSLGAQALCERIHVARVPLVLATSKFARTRLAYHYGIPVDKIRVVPEPIDLDLWTPLLAGVPRRMPAEFTVLCVAHMYPRKSLGTLLAAMARLRVAHPQARLRLVGQGPEEQHLRRLAARLGLGDTVAFLGHVPLPALAAEYANADVFCLPSRQEGFGIVYLEAMAAGLPVVACRSSAVPEVVADGDTGLLVPPLDPDALAVALARLADDAPLRHLLGAAGRRRATLYTPERVATAFLRTVMEEGLLPARAGTSADDLHRTGAP